MILTERSLKNLTGVHPDLVAVVKLAASRAQMDFVVTEGVRTKARQQELYDAKATRTMNSRHIPGADKLGKAVDLAAVVAGEVRWDWPLYSKLAEQMQDAADDLKVPIVWGGNWGSFKDGPHFELDRKKYP